MNAQGDSPTTKSEWRNSLLERRGQMDKTTHSAEATALVEHIAGWVRENSANTLAAYVPVGHEPGSLDLLRRLTHEGCRVLLPIVIGAGHPLDWVEYTGPDSLRPATYGLLEPAGQRLGAAAVAAADALLVPALAVDQRGVRLGRGAGYYDRSLRFVASSAELLAVVRDEEFVTELPGEEHDVRMHGVVTPERGLVRLAASEDADAPTGVT